MRLIVLVVVFVTFTVWSSTIAFSHGLLGFLTLAAKEPWAAQMLTDLGIALFVAWTWLRHEAKARGIPAWPYQVATVLLGSIGVLAFLIHREVAKRAGDGAEAAAPRATTVQAARAE